MCRRIVLLIVMGCVTGSMGCASARYVSKQGDSGVIAIPANTDTWPFHYRQEGESLIRQHVGADYEIVDEREVVTGSRVTNNQQTQSELVPNKRQPNAPGERTVTSGTVNSTNTTEWQIAYKRRTSGGAGAVTGNAPAPAILPTGGTQPATPR